MTVMVCLENPSHFLLEEQKNGFPLRSTPLRLTKVEKLKYQSPSRLSIKNSPDY